MNQSLWRPSASILTLQKRARLLREIRAYFDARGVLEVETPMLSANATVDAYIESFTTQFRPIGRETSQYCYLHTSPEFAMKRLLCAGSGDIYSLGRVFRNGEAGGRHNPEFTMLEWYRVGMDDQSLMDDVTSLLSSISNFQEIRRCSYGELFEQYLHLNPYTASNEQLSQLVSDKVDARLSGLDRNDCLDLLFSRFVESNLQSPEPDVLCGYFVYNYPATMSALARLTTNTDGHPVAARFELFVNGVELANGYHELLDARQQQARFEQEQRVRRERGYQIYPYDQNMIDALTHGMPDCAGVALGIDRLLMLMLGTRNIADVLAFDFSRA